MKNLILIIIITLFLSTGSYANSTAVSDYAGQLSFVPDNDLSIQKETIEFLASQGIVPVKVSYSILNKSDKTQKIDITFSLPNASLSSLRGVSNDGTPNQFRRPNIKLTINGKKIIGDGWIEILMHKGKEIMNGTNIDNFPWLEDTDFCYPGSNKSAKYDSICEQFRKETNCKTQTDCKTAFAETKVSRVYRWSYEFQPNQTVQIIHEYDMGRGINWFRYTSTDGNSKKQSPIPPSDISSKKDDSFCIKDLGNDWDKTIATDGATEGAYHWIEYTLGSNWKEPIKEFELIINKKNSKEIISTCFPSLKKINSLRFQSKIKDFKPDKNIAIGYFIFKQQQIKKQGDRS